MSGGDPGDIPKFTGLSKYFNSFTTDGRANVAKACLGSFVLIYLAFKLKPSKKKE